MSFTSSLSVRIRTALVYVEEHRFKSVSMENILQSIVRIIIIGSLCQTINVNCNRQFLPPPLPYYQNEDYDPGFTLPYDDRVPVYYREHPSISYQNMNSYPPFQLFHQNENFKPPQFTSPEVRYSIPPIFPYKSKFYHSHDPHQRINLGISQVNYKKPSNFQAGSRDRPEKTSQKKPAFYATNIIVKEESQSPYYQDDYKNYHDEDYSDSYADDISSPPSPCLLNSPYRYFESPKLDPNNPNTDSKYTLCNPFFQPNFGNGIYTVKMPITLLPSRFPPRVEQFIERIQNYFSTYTHQETPKPQNHTSSTTTIQASAETTSEADAYSAVTTESPYKSTVSGDNEELVVTQTSPDLFQVATSEATNEKELVTEITTATEIRITQEEPSSTAIPEDGEHLQLKEESQAVSQSAQSPNEVEEVSSTTETFVSYEGGLQANMQNFQKPEVLQTETSSLNERSPENQTLHEFNHSVNSSAEKLETETQFMDVKDLNNTTESTEAKEEAKDSSSTIQPTDETLQVANTNS